MLQAGINERHSSALMTHHQSIWFVCSFLMADQSQEGSICKTILLRNDKGTTEDFETSGSGQSLDQKMEISWTRFNTYYAAFRLATATHLNQFC